VSLNAALMDFVKHELITTQIQ